MRRRFLWAAALAAVASVSLACGRAKAPAPPNASPITIEGALSNKFVKAGASSQIVARIEIATPARTTTARPPVNLALVVDTSGSMDGKAIENARAASLALLDTLTPRDRLSVVVFHSKAEVLLPNTRIEDANMGELRAKIGAMKAAGTTAMTEGLRLGIQQVESNLERDGVNRVVLLGDGVPNDDHAILPLVAQSRSQGVSITTLGLGNDYDETLMGRIAQESGGKFSLVEDSAKVASFFQEEVVRLHRVVARNAVLELHSGPGVTVTNVIGRPYSRIDHGLAVQLGDVSLGEKQEIVVELSGTAPKESATVEALDAVLQFQEGVGGAVREERVYLGAKATAVEATLTSGRNEEVENAAARARDAAATLLKIERDRRTDPMTSKKTALGFDEAMPAPASVAGAPAKMSAEQVRQAHSNAIQNFQAH